VSSEAYQKLRELCEVIKIDAAWFSPRKWNTYEYNHIAVYLTVARFSLAWTVVSISENTLKDRTLKLVPGLTDSEWEIIQNHMLRIAVDDSPASMKAMRIDWIRTLDTLREFEREV